MCVPWGFDERVQGRGLVHTGGFGSTAATPWRGMCREPLWAKLCRVGPRRRVPAVVVPADEG
jgi:hypothetical protein